jgi:hypothetical protein
MAITILDTPATYSSMHTDLWFVSSSTNGGTTNFKFVYDVKVNGSLVARSKVFPDVSGNYGVFNAAPVVRAYTSNYFEPSGSSILVASNNKLKVDYVLEVREEVSGSIAVLPDASGSFSAYNYYPPLFADMISIGNDTPLVLDDYYENLLVENYSDNWLTDREVDKMELEFGDQCFISYFRKTTGGAYSATIDVVNESGSVLSSYTGSLTLAGEFNMFSLQAAAINTFAGSTLITEDTFGYHVYINYVNGGTSFVSPKVKVKHVCYPKYRQYNIHFLNRLGGWDTMKFALVNKRQTEFTRSSYRRSEWQLSGSSMSNVDAYNRYNETTLNYSIQHKDKMHLVSDWVSENDYEWLAQLVGSSICYVEVLSGYFPCTIASTNYEYKLKTSEKLFNFEVDIEVGKYINSQYR